MHQKLYEDPSGRAHCPVKPAAALAAADIWRTKIHWQRAEVGAQAAYKYPFIPQCSQNIPPHTCKHHNARYHAHHNISSHQPSLNIDFDIPIFLPIPQLLFQINILNRNMSGQGSSGAPNNWRIIERMPGQWTSFTHSFHQPQTTEDTYQNAHPANGNPGSQNPQDLFTGGNQSQGAVGANGIAGPEHDFLDHGIAGGYVTRGRRVGGDTAGGGFRGSSLGGGLFGGSARPRGAAIQPGLENVAEEDETVLEHRSSNGLFGSRPSFASSSQNQRHQPHTNLFTEGYEWTQRHGIWDDSRWPSSPEHDVLARRRDPVARSPTASSPSQGRRNPGATNATVTINANTVNVTAMNVSPTSDATITDNSGGIRANNRTGSRRRRRSSTPPENEGLRFSSSGLGVGSQERPARRARYFSSTHELDVREQPHPTGRSAYAPRRTPPTREQPGLQSAGQVPQQSATSRALLSVLDAPQQSAPRQSAPQQSATSLSLMAMLDGRHTRPGVPQMRQAPPIPGVPARPHNIYELVELQRRQELWASGPVRTPFTRQELDHGRMRTIEYWRVKHHQEQFLSQPPVDPIVTEERRGRRVPIFQTQPLNNDIHVPGYRFTRVGPRLRADQQRPFRPDGWTAPRRMALPNQTPYDRMEFNENVRRAQEDKERRRREVQQPGLRPPPNLLPDTPEGFANLRWAVEGGSAENVTMQLLEQIRARDEAASGSVQGAFETFRRKAEAERGLEQEEEELAESDAPVRRGEDAALAKFLRERRALENAARAMEALDALRAEAWEVFWEAAEVARLREARRAARARVASDAAGIARLRMVERSTRSRVREMDAERRERSRLAAAAYDRRTREAAEEGKRQRRESEGVGGSS
ncbi:uncharacterized protein BDZ99DRAFT_479539 [Mytilinidion resinicola]|uniref:Uncharacterized protein n=1 Tax=Mytilinidion resinicola TaxID=574789 RepID=A0A6A6YBS6_9PEZI|nr:uncharacterized protein BDZ99DRAFT_479539 [Mytilinidion resinicola]KAF2806271.1 hypothetical protein BDZ99DRAFT_479539 [Mytilinidion resinicola]